MTPFDLMKICLEKTKRPTDEEIEKYVNQFIMINHLSCDSQFSALASELSRLRLTNLMFFDCLYYGLPKGKRYIPYSIKKANVDGNIKYIMDFYNCSFERATEYVHLISKEELQKIKEFYERRGLK